MILEVMTLKIGWKSPPLFFFFFAGQHGLSLHCHHKGKRSGTLGCFTGWIVGQTELLNVVAGWADGRKLCPACLWMKVFACLDSSGCIVIGKLFKTFYCPFRILSVRTMHDNWVYCSCQYVFRCLETWCVFPVMAAEVGVNFVQHSFKPIVAVL